MGNSDPDTFLARVHRPLDDVAGVPMGARDFARRKQLRLVWDLLHVSRRELVRSKHVGMVATKATVAAVERFLGCSWDDARTLVAPNAGTDEQTDPLFAKWCAAPSTLSEEILGLRIAEFVYILGNLGAYAACHGARTVRQLLRLPYEPLYDAIGRRKLSTSVNLLLRRERELDRATPTAAAEPLNLERTSLLAAIEHAGWRGLCRALSATHRATPLSAIQLSADFTAFTSRMDLQTVGDLTELDLPTRMTRPRWLSLARTVASYLDDPGAAEAARQRPLLAGFAAHMEHLDARRRDILERRTSGDETLVADVSRRVGLSSQRVAEIEKRAALALQRTPWGMHACRQIADALRGGPVPVTDLSDTRFWYGLEADPKRCALVANVLAGPVHLVRVGGEDWLSRAAQRTIDGFFAEAWRIARAIRLPAPLSLFHAANWLAPLAERGGPRLVDAIRDAVVSELVVEGDSVHAVRRGKRTISSAASWRRREIVHTRGPRPRSTLNKSARAR